MLVQKAVCQGTASSRRLNGVMTQEGAYWEGGNVSVMRPGWTWVLVHTRTSRHSSIPSSRPARLDCIWCGLCGGGVVKQNGKQAVGIYDLSGFWKWAETGHGNPNFTNP